MNNLIKISTKADRAKPKSDAKAKADIAASRRGAAMLSRFGIATKGQYTCFFRGANGETGGLHYSENTTSHVKQLKKPVDTNASDIINDPVEAHNVKDYIETDAIRQALELKMQAAQAKGNSSQTGLATMPLGAQTGGP